MKLFIVLLLLSVIQPSLATTYKWTDKNGVIHFSENKPDEIVVEKLFTKTGLIVFILGLAGKAYAQDSQCFGSSSNGYLVGGIQLPAKGENFISYSQLGILLGRTYVHSKVAEVVIEAYDSLAISNPHTLYKYGETGFSKGGEFKPHRTHQNGLSVDFMVPVIDKSGKSTYFPTTISNKFGYDVEFDSNGKFESFDIDFDAMAAHIIALDKKAKARGFAIKRVIFEPELLSKLLQVASADYLLKNITFFKKKSWVKHDEHYHVDFMITCSNK